jgi:hypothetical protein
VFSEAIRAPAEDVYVLLRIIIRVRGVPRKALVFPLRPGHSTTAQFRSAHPRLAARLTLPALTATGVQGKVSSAGVSLASAISFRSQASGMTWKWRAQSLFRSSRSLSSTVRLNVFEYVQKAKPRANGTSAFDGPRANVTVPSSADVLRAGVDSLGRVFL